MPDTNKMITVFTPTYNRAYILPKLYDSLLSQTDKAFKWMIVDDGSDDGTKELVDQWKSENKIEIGYIYQKNRGKAMAHNAAMEYIDTELVCICDSDDVLTERAIEFIEKCWKEGGCGRPEIAGIVAYMREKSEESIPEEKKLPKMKSQKLYEIFRGGGRKIFETVQIYRTDVLKENLFPHFEGENFVPEMAVWIQIDLKYEVLILPEILEIYEYLPDGYTNSGVKAYKNNPLGYAYLFKNKFLYEKNGFKKLIELGKCAAMCHIAKNNCLLRDISNVNIFLSLPAAFAAWLKYTR